MALRDEILDQLKQASADPYRVLDSLYIPLDRKHVRRTKNLRHIPTERYRRGGKYAYSEWAHVIGIFQTLIFLNLDKKEENSILDIGCGTGLLGIAAEPFLGQAGKYVGLDVIKKDIDFCVGHYPATNFEFIHFNVVNSAYAPEQEDLKTTWPLESESFDLVTALSVWTHLGEEDALFYFAEINRVLRPNGKAIVTFFLLDENYDSTVAKRSSKNGRFHMTPQNHWVFDKQSYGSDAWRHPAWANVPEAAIGITNAGLDRLIEYSGLKLIGNYSGNWKEIPGIFFQDVLVFQKT